MQSVSFWDTILRNVTVVTVVIMFLVTWLPEIGNTYLSALTSLRLDDFSHIVTYIL